MPAEVQSKDELTAALFADVEATLRSIEEEEAVQAERERSEAMLARLLNREAMPA